VSSPASVKRAVIVSEQQQPSHEDERRGLMHRLRIWQQILIAELLNFLERGHDDLKRLR